ncbi:MAG: fimbria/pilus periplasmic chaperone [Candidatus Dasytiphilus stammeri]
MPKKKTKTRYYNLLRVIISYFIICYSSFVLATNNSSILIWPLDPVIEADQNAISLWLENHNNNSLLVQIRVFSWKQTNNDNQLLEQHEVIVSPPMVEIYPKKKQLIRLIKLINPPQDHEWSYRIIIDEIPQPLIEEPTKNNQRGLNFKMRYSIPLFINSKNIWTKIDYQHLSQLKPIIKPILSYRIITKNEKKLLIIHNKGLVHAKITDIRFLNGKIPYIINNGFLEYILPQSEIVLSFSTPFPLRLSQLSLMVKVNDNLEFQKVIPEN